MFVYGPRGFMLLPKAGSAPLIHSAPRLNCLTQQAHFAAESSGVFRPPLLESGLQAT